MGPWKTYIMTSSSSSSSLSHRYPSVSLISKTPFLFQVNITVLALSFPLHWNFGFLADTRQVYTPPTLLLTLSNADTYMLECQLTKSWILSSLIPIVMYCFIQSIYYGQLPWQIHNFPFSPAKKKSCTVRSGFLFQFYGFQSLAIFKQIFFNLYFSLLFFSKICCRCSVQIHKK
jgi:hypothetical protein